MARGQDLICSPISMKAAGHLLSRYCVVPILRSVEYWFMCLSWDDKETRENCHVNRHKHTFVKVKFSKG